MAPLFTFKRFKRFSFIGWIWVVSVALGAFTPTWAEQVDVRMVIDVSGSMKRNDPKNLRQPAVDLLVQLLPQDSRAGVWTFGKYVNMLVPHRDVDQDWQDMARDQSSEINSVGLYTNIGEALEKAAKASAREDATQSIILLTDGMVDVSQNPEENKAEWRRIVDQVIPTLKQQGVTVHTVALSEHADDHLLEKLALATDGTAAVANSAEDLMKIFLNAFDVAAPAQQVPLRDNSFVVDSSVEEFTALIFRENVTEQTQLVGPDDSVYDHTSKHDDLSWYRSNDYDLITMKRPLEGEWKLRANIAPESRVTVVSDLQLRVKSLPNNVFSGVQETLSFVLQEDGKTLQDNRFLALLNSSASLGYGPQNTVVKQVWSHDFSQFAPPNDGVYKVPLPQFREVGMYELAVAIDGKTFNRQFQHRITVREPFTAELVEKISEQGVTQNLLTVKSHSNAIVPEKTQIAATIVNPSKRKLVKPLSLTEYDYWQTPIATELPGTYTVTVNVSGENLRQEEFEYQLQPLLLDFNPETGFSEQLAPISSTASSSSSQAASSSSVASTPPVATPETQDPPADNLESDPAPESSAAMPPWLLYALLGLGNVLVLGGGFLLFRKLMADNNDKVLEDLDKPIMPLPEESSAEQAAQKSDASDLEEDFMSMPADDLDEDEPPMEDLDEAEEVAMREVTANTTTDSDDLDMEDDFGVDDLEEEPSDAEGEDDAEEDDTDMAAAMLKAQGLDLAEDELDDAITNLIDELDGEPRPEDDREPPDDLDDFDFGDDSDEDDDNKK